MTRAARFLLSMPPISDAGREVLRQAHQLARATAVAGARHEVGSAPPGRCRYCGGLWRPYFGTTLDGHASCTVTPAFMRFVLDVTETGTMCREVAETLGVTLKTLRAWIVRAMDIRDEERRAGA